MYCKFILVFFKVFSKDVRFVYFKYVRDILFLIMLVNKEDEYRVLYSLRSFEIIIIKEGDLKRVLYFYDLYNGIFKVMFLVEMFLFEFFKLKEWLLFLRKIGMVCEIFFYCFRKFVEEVVYEVVM